jgi:hypothetical protein
LAAPVVDLSPCPDFAAKAGVVLDLYQRRFAGERLGADEFVVSADEKTSIQARCRCHPPRPPANARAMRVEHEYERGGALAYLVAWDVHRARLFGRCEATTGIAPFGRLVEQVMASEPYASAARVFWVVDNGSSHRGQASIDRLEGDWPTLRLVHLPVHASWLNQVEIYLSICQRKALTPTTSPIWTRWLIGCWASSAATSRPRSRLPGASPGPAWSGCCATCASLSGVPLLHDSGRRGLAERCWSGRSTIAAPVESPRGRTTHQGRLRPGRAGRGHRQRDRRDGCVGRRRGRLGRPAPAPPRPREGAGRLAGRLGPGRRRPGGAHGPQ